MFVNFRIFLFNMRLWKKYLMGELIRETKKSFGLTEAF